MIKTGHARRIILDVLKDLELIEKEKSIKYNNKKSIKKALAISNNKNFNIERMIQQTESAMGFPEEHKESDKLNLKHLFLLKNESSLSHGAVSNFSPEKTPPSTLDIPLGRKLTRNSIAGLPTSQQARKSLLASPSKGLGARNSISVSPQKNSYKNSL